MANTTSNRKKPAKANKATKVTKSTKTTKVSATKKPAAKPAKVAASSKTTASKSAVPTVTEPTSARRGAKAPLTPLERIRSLHLSSAVVYTLFAGVIIGFVTMATSAITLSIQAKDQFASRNQVVLGPAHEVLYDLNPKYVLVAALLVSALGSLLLATKLRARYEASLAGRISGLRWIVFGLSSALTVAFLNLLVGVNDIATIKLSAGAMFLAALLSWFAERDNAKATHPRWLAYGGAWLAGLLAFTPILGSLVGTSIWGMERFGWHVYTVVAVVILGYVVMATIASNVIKAGATREYTDIEEKYLRTDLLVKFLVVLVILTALQ